MHAVTIMSLKAIGLQLSVDIVLGALKMQDRKMTDKDIAGGGKCRTGI